MTNALTLIILVLFLTACSSTPEVVVKTQTEYVHPPEALLRDCPVPEYTGNQWKDVSDYALMLQLKLRQCNADKKAIRELGQED